MVWHILKGSNLQYDPWSTWWFVKTLDLQHMCESASEHFCLKLPTENKQQTQQKNLPGTHFVAEYYASSSEFKIFFPSSHRMRWQEWDSPADLVFGNKKGSENTSRVEQPFLHLWLYIADWEEESLPKYYPQFKSQAPSGQAKVPEHLYPSSQRSDSLNPPLYCSGGTQVSIVVNKVPHSICPSTHRKPHTTATAPSWQFMLSTVYSSSTRKI